MGDESLNKFTIYDFFKQPQIMISDLKHNSFQNGKTEYVFGSRVGFSTRI